MSRKRKTKGIEEEMEELLDKMFKKFDKIFISNFGKKCKYYHYTCIACGMWDVYERFKKDLEKEYLKH